MEDEGRYFYEDIDSQVRLCDEILDQSLSSCTSCRGLLMTSPSADDLLDELLSALDDVIPGPGDDGQVTMSAGDCNESRTAENTLKNR